MRTSKRPSKPVHLRDPLHRQLHVYALAASAAGVSILALAQPSEAEIIFTRADIENPASLDLTGNGAVNFTFRYTAHTYYNFIWVSAAYKGNGVDGT